MKIINTLSFYLFILFACPQQLWAMSCKNLLNNDPTINWLTEKGHHVPGTLGKVGKYIYSKATNSSPFLELEFPHVKMTVEFEGFPHLPGKKVDSSQRMNIYIKGGQNHPNFKNLTQLLFSERAKLLSEKKPDLITEYTASEKTRLKRRHNSLQDPLDTSSSEPPNTNFIGKIDRVWSNKSIYLNTFWSKHLDIFFIKNTGRGQAPGLHPITSALVIITPYPEVYARVLEVIDRLDQGAYLDPGL